MISEVGKRYVPAWYELMYQPNGLTLRTHVNCRQQLTLLQPDLQVLEFIRQKHNIPGFIPINPDGWGFGGVLEQVIDNPPWDTWFMSWPEDAQRQDFLIRALTLSRIFHALNASIFPNIIPEDTGTPQLFEFDGVWEGGNNTNGWGMMITFSPYVRQWLAQLPPHAPIPELSRAMVHVFERMYGRPAGMEAHFCKAETSPNGPLVVTCPGIVDKHRLVPCEETLQEGEGFAVAPHNFDGVPSQFPVYAGLAKLHDMVREWMAQTA